MPSYGEIWGVGIALITIVLSILFGDKLILGYLNICEVKKEAKLYDIFSNFCFQQSLSTGKIYTSHIFKNNVLVVDSFMSNDFNIVIGENLFEVLNENELKSMVFAAIDDVNSRSTKVNLLFVELFILCYLPLIILNKVFLKRFAVLSSIMSFVFFPLISICYFVFSKLNYLRRDKLFENLTGVSSENFCSGLLKLKPKEVFSGEDSLVLRILYHLSIAENHFGYFFDYVLYKGIKKR